MVNCKVVLVLLVSLLLVQLSDQQERRVNMDFFVMSKCPDAKVCENLYQGVVSSVGSILTINFHYLGHADATQETGFYCMHGQTECYGNMAQLCVGYFYPNNWTQFNFINCMDNDQSNIPNNEQSCTNSVKVDYNQIHTCATGSLGKQLLSTSFNYSTAADVTHSCTMFLEGSLFCIHDSTWQQCKANTVNTIIPYICKAYTGSNPPAACKSLKMIDNNY